MHHLGHYLEGQGHSMTLQQNRVRPISLLFEVWISKLVYKNYHHIEMTKISCLCPKPIRGASPGSTGSCFHFEKIKHGCSFVRMKLLFKKYGNKGKLRPKCIIFMKRDLR